MRGGFGTASCALTQCGSKSQGHSINSPETPRLDATQSQLLITEGELATLANKTEKATTMLAALKTRLNTLVATESTDDGDEIEKSTHEKIN